MSKRHLDVDSLVPDPRNVKASVHEQQELREYIEEAANRRIEALKLYQPLPFQEAFHECRAKECLLQKGNRAGGSLAGFVEDARAVTGQDPYEKYPKRDGVLVCLGYGEGHIGRVIYKYLFRPGAFKIIRDEETNEWRVFRPWDFNPEDPKKGGDLHREKEAKPAPPLIPNRYLDGKIAWTKRSDRIFSVARLTTGWEIYALNSAGDPSQAQGFDVNLYHIDEDLAQPGWYTEAIGRTAIPKGLIRWTALPHAKNDDIVKMIQRAEDEQGQEKPSTIRITASMFDNPYYPEESKQTNLKLWASEGEDEVRKRAYGEMVIDSILMYPTFDRRLHTAIKHTEPRHEIQRILTERQGEPPETWCRYASFDPGHSVGAVTFWAVPPPSLGDFRICYDELYLRQCDAVKFGIAFEAKTKNYQFQDFIIDAHGGRLRELASGNLPQQQYELQLEQRGVVCNARGSKFRAGCDEPKTRELAMREWLRIRDDGSTKFLIVAQRCPNTCREFERFKKKTTRIGGQEVPTDEGNRKANTHAVETAEYAAAHGLPYVKPKSSLSKTTWLDRVMKSREERALRRRMKGGADAKTHRTLGPQGASS